MKKVQLIILILFIGIFSENHIYAATGGWNTKGNVSMFLNEMAISNWAKGGENQIAMTGLFSYTFDYHNVDTSIVWDNSFTTGYGFQTSDQYAFRKSEDKIDFTSKYGLRAFKDYYYSFAASFQTQYWNGYKYPNDSTIVSKFLAPAYLIIAAGFDYKPNPKLSISFYPLSGRLILVKAQELADIGAYGVKKAVLDTAGNIITPGETSRFDFGAAANLTFTFSPMENIDISTKLDLFNNYTDPKVSNRKNIDFNSETTVNMKINSYISANIYLNMIYDQDIPIPIFKTIDGVKTQVGTGPRLQIKQTLGIGFSYNFH